MTSQKSYEVCLSLTALGEKKDKYRLSVGLECNQEL